MQDKETDLPLVSVVIPSYNAAATLPATLDSVWAQTYPRIEVIVVDDGSTDATGEVLARCGSRVRVIRQANGGLASARNTGCTAASGRFIALLDADDLCEPERIGVQVAFMAARPDVVLCGTEFCAFPHEDPPAQRLHGLVVDSADPRAQAQWWAGVLGATAPGGGGRPWRWVEDLPATPFDYLVFNPVPEPKTVKNRWHWDVDCDDVEELVGRGATVLRHPDDDIGWHVLADPEGNEFCAFGSD